LPQTVLRSLWRRFVLRNLTLHTFLLQIGLIPEIDALVDNTYPAAKPDKALLDLLSKGSSTHIFQAVLGRPLFVALIELTSSHGVLLLEHAALMQEIAERI